MSLAVEIKNLKKTFNDVEALRGVNFHVKKGEIFGLLGPNGAGKTTTLEIMEGLKKPDSGSIRICGFNAVTESGEVKKRIGVQLQSSEYFPLLSLAELIRLFASIYGKRINAREHLKLVGLQEKADEVIKNLSGGQKHRFAIAAALVNDPEVLFLDEPTTGLDPHVRRDLWLLIKQLNKRGVTILLTTHYMEEAEYLCDRVAIIERGKILTDDTPENLIRKHSNATQIVFYADDEEEYRWLEKVKDVKQVYKEYPKIVIEVKSIDAVREVLKLLHEKKVYYSGLTVKNGNLEDVYLHLTGKHFGAKRK
jgi:ABC-2 type transport system ATP-binding protein